MPVRPPIPRTRNKLPNEANAGRVAGVFGLKGELKVAPSRIGEDALAAGMDIRALLADGTSRMLRVRTLRCHQGRPLLAFVGIDDANAAQRLGRRDVVRRSRRRRVG